MDQTLVALAIAFAVLFAIAYIMTDNMAFLVLALFVSAAVLIGMIVAYNTPNDSSLSKKKKQQQQQKQDQKKKNISYTDDSSSSSNDVGRPLEDDNKVICVNGDYGDDEWDVGYKPADVDTSREKLLAKLGTDAMHAMAEQTVPQLEDPPQTDQKCGISTDWQAGFLGFPTTFISNSVNSECGRTDGREDTRAWFKRMNDVQYERSRRMAEATDPYKSHRARQSFMQFLASGMTNKKATYERPIEQLEDSTCFQKRVQQK